jgi:RimJ/RimL family protein N-acetyltransferase
MELHDDAGLTLRAWSEADAPAVYAACQDPEIQRWMPVIPRPYTEEDARAFVTGQLGLGPYQLAVTEHGRVVGAIGMRVNEAETGHIGYWCVPEARGRGIITRALRLLCRYALSELGLERLELVTDPDNAASQRVAEKVGFRREGVLRSHLQHPDGRRRDSVMFSLLPGELA